VLDDEVIRPLDRPVSPRRAGRAARQPRARRRGDQAQRAMPRHLHRHTGRAVVFDSQPDMLARIADPLDCDEDTVLVLRNAGPVGAPGMPEWGNLPIPKKLLDNRACATCCASRTRA
jgi:dihydroxyacid dehydratase/phosphogluconate dehydratase